MVLHFNIFFLYNFGAFIWGWMKRQWTYIPEMRRPSSLGLDSLFGTKVRAGKPKQVWSLLEIPMLELTKFLRSKSRVYELKLVIENSREEETYLSFLWLISLSLFLLHCTVELGFLKASILFLFLSSATMERTHTKSLPGQSCISGMGAWGKLRSSAS